MFTQSAGGINDAKCKDLEKLLTINGIDETLSIGGLVNISIN
ncbi:MAG: hypothetical protein ACTS4X_01500 [Candidatus Hodgkinia cicadicola]